jgi:hypothetical protein
LEHV